MKIMIGGGFDDENPSSSQRISMFAESLAKQIILQGYQLRCGNPTHLDAAVINAACDAIDNDLVCLGSWFGQNKYVLAVRK
jgi:hypothetical protein